MTALYTDLFQRTVRFDVVRHKRTSPKTKTFCMSRISRSKQKKFVEIKISNFEVSQSADSFKRLDGFIINK